MFEDGRSGGRVVCQGSLTSGVSGTPGVFECQKSIDSDTK